MINQVILIGNTGGDPEVRTLENGTKVAVFSLATTKKFTDKEGMAKELTTWHRIVCWRALADVVDKYVKKGSQLFIRGEINTREWTNDKGEKRYATDIVAGDLKLLGRKPPESVAEKIAQSYEDRIPSGAPVSPDPAPFEASVPAGGGSIEGMDDLPF